MEDAAGGIKWPANGFFQGFFEGSVRLRNGDGRLTQAMTLASLMRHAGEGPGHGDDQCFLIIADQTAQVIAQVSDRLEQPLLEGLMIGGEQRHFVEYQAKLQFANDVKRRVACLGFESVDGHNETMPAEIGRVLLKPEMIGAAEQDEKDANQVQHLASGDG